MPGTKRRKRDGQAPKKPMTGYNCFFKIEREKLGDPKTQEEQKNFHELGRWMGERWKKLSAQERQVYESLASEDRVRYTAEMAEYQLKVAETASSPDAAAQEIFDCSINDSGATWYVNVPNGVAAVTRGSLKKPNSARQLLQLCQQSDQTQQQHDDQSDEEDEADSDDQSETSSESPTTAEKAASKRRRASANKSAAAAAARQDSSGQAAVKKEKRPKSAYNIFFSEERARLRQDPNFNSSRLSFGDFGKVIAASWDKLPEEEKVQLQVRAEESRQAYFKKVMAHSPLFAAGGTGSSACNGSSNGCIGNGSSGSGSSTDCIDRAASALLQAHAGLGLSRAQHAESSNPQQQQQQQTAHGSSNSSGSANRKRSSTGRVTTSIVSGVSSYKHSPHVEKLLIALGGGGVKGGAAAHDAEVYASDLAAALELSATALEETAQALQQSGVRPVKAGLRYA